MRLDQRHLTRLRIFWNFLFGRIYEITESEAEFAFRLASEPLEPLTDDDQFEDWNQAKKHPS